MVMTMMMIMTIMTLWILLSFKMILIMILMMMIMIEQLKCSGPVKLYAILQSRANKFKLFIKEIQKMTLSYIAMHFYYRKSMVN